MLLMTKYVWLLSLLLISVYTIEDTMTKETLSNSPRENVACVNRHDAINKAM